MNRIKSFPRRTAVASLVLACTAGLPGCGSDQPYQLAPVSGVVTLDGKPLSGAVVSYQPESHNERLPGPGSSGRTDAEGRYSLTTIHGDPGAIVATHAVRIYSSSGATAVAPSREMDELATQGIQEKVPAQYNYNSTLKVDVPAEGLPSADFELKTPGPNA